MAIPTSGRVSPHPSFLSNPSSFLLFPCFPFFFLRASCWLTSRTHESISLSSVHSNASASFTPSLLMVYLFCSCVYHRPSIMFNRFAVGVESNLGPVVSHGFWFERIHVLLLSLRRSAATQAGTLATSCCLRDYRIGQVIDIDEGQT